MGKYDTLFKLNIQIQNLGGKLLYIQRLPKTLSEKKYLENNQKLSEYKKSDCCAVIGLGPSLKKVDLSRLPCDTIVTNRYYLFDPDKQIKPTFYYMTDGDFFVGKSIQDFQAALNQYQDTPFLVNGKFRRNIQELEKRDDRLFYLYQWNGLFRSGKKISLDHIMPAFGNVVCGAIAFAMGVGYRKIILLGCDFNSFAFPNAVHCYGESDESRKISLSFELFNYSFEADTHMQLNKYAVSHGISIVNQSEGSLIDAYMKEPFLYGDT